MTGQNYSVVEATTETPIDKQQNVAFDDGVKDYLVEKKSEPLYETANSSVANDVGLGKFLARPVKIATISWTAAYAGQKIDPWALYLNNLAVSSKLDYYSYLRGSLNIQVTLNGTPFHYGRLMISYMPCNDGAPKSAITNNTWNSQLPHLLLDPSTSPKYSMVLPFVSPYDWIDLDDVDGARLGVFYINDLNSLSMSNTITIEPVTVTIFAWMENPVLSIPTSSVTATFVAQGKDEYQKGKGIVSGVASTVATYAGRLADAPIIGRLARATQIGANAISGIASLFGWSKPNQLLAPTFMKPLGTSPFAPAEWVDTSLKLTFDPKQEVTVDPRTVGLTGTDELSFDYIKSIPSYSQSATWATTDANGTIVNSWSVTPQLVAETVGPGASQQFAPTALSFIALPFKNWTGGICYCIQVIASQYHRGRLRVTYVPNGTSFTEDTYNMFYSEIIDITEAREFNIVVGWAQRVPWKEVLNVNVGSIAGAAYDNGKIFITVLNELTAPLASQSVEVNMWIKGMPSFKVANPISDANHPFYLYTTVVPQADTTGDCESYTLELVPDAPRDGVSCVTFGEDIVSFRTMIKRFASYRRIYLDRGAGALAANTYFNRHLPHYPFQPGWNPLGWDETVGLVAYDYVACTPLAYVRTAFLGWRGSVRYKIKTPLPLNGRQDNGMSVTRFSMTSAAAPTKITTYTATGKVWSDSSRFFMATDTAKQALNGTIWTTNQTNNLIEYESPNYNALKYSTSDRPAYPDDIHDYTIISMNSNNHNNANPLLCNTIDVAVASGEDMNFFFFTGAPTYYIQAPPAASITT